MKLIKKRDVFRYLDKYVEGELSIGECIDECETLDLSDLIISLNRIIDTINKQDEGYRQEVLERLQTITEGLKEWGWKSELSEYGRND